MAVDGTPQYGLPSVWTVHTFMSTILKHDRAAKKLYCQKCPQENEELRPAAPCTLCASCLRLTRTWWWPKKNSLERWSSTGSSQKWMKRVRALGNVRGMSLKRRNLFMGWFTGPRCGGDGDPDSEEGRCLTGGTRSSLQEHVSQQYLPSHTKLMIMRYGSPVGLFCGGNCPTVPPFPQFKRTARTSLLQPSRLPRS